MEEINAVTPQQIDTLRKSFNEKVAAENPAFHPEDIERVKFDDLWLRRFICNAESKLDTALNQLYECCQWRKEFGTNELDETKLPEQLFGVLLIRNEDKWGKKLLIFKAKHHTKGQIDISLLQKFVVYYFEQIERLTNGDQISIIFDMKDTGWNNMDMDFVRYLITLLKTYYPYFVNYLIIFEMPWLLNAAWKIIKGWLPPKFVDRVKFQDKKTLKEYIDLDNQLEEWGGNDKYVFKFEAGPKIKRNYNNNVPQSDAMAVEPVPKTRSKVQIAGSERPTSSEVHQIDYTEMGNDRSPMVTPSPSAQNNCLADVPDRIQFRPSDNSDDLYTAQLAVKNISPGGDVVIVKIKTTSPERYRVKPIIFVLSRNAKGLVNIETHAGVSATTMTKDRFQIQVAVVPANMLPLSGSDSDGSIHNGGDIGNNFKQIMSSGTTFETYRATIAVEARAGDKGPGSGSSISLSDDRLRRGLEDLERKITDSVSKQVNAKIARLENLLKIALCIIALLTLIIFWYLWKMPGYCSQSCAAQITSSSWSNIVGDGSCGA